jgi:hypothetical protein
MPAYDTMMGKLLEEFGVMDLAAPEMPESFIFDVGVARV